MSPLNPVSFALVFAISGFAIYYVATMLAEGRGPFNIFGRWRVLVLKYVQVPYLNTLPEAERRYEPKHWLWEGVTCPKCLSIYLAAPIAWVLTQWFLLGWIELALVWFGLAGLARWFYSFE